MKNTPTVNVERSAKEYMMMLEAADKTIKDQETLIQRLQVQLEALSNGTPINLLDLPQLPQSKKIQKLTAKYF